MGRARLLRLFNGRQGGPASTLRPSVCLHHHETAQFGCSKGGLVVLHGIHARPTRLGRSTSLWLQPTRILDEASSASVMTVALQRRPFEGSSCNGRAATCSGMRVLPL